MELLPTLPPGGGTWCQHCSLFSALLHGIKLRSIDYFFFFPLSQLNHLLVRSRLFVLPNNCSTLTWLLWPMLLTFFFQSIQKKRKGGKSLLIVGCVQFSLPPLPCLEGPATFTSSTLPSYRQALHNLHTSLVVQ